MQVLLYASGMAESLFGADRTRGTVLDSLEPLANGHAAIANSPLQ